LRTGLEQKAGGIDKKHWGIAGGGIISDI